jgi:putative hemolysin
VSADPGSLAGDFAISGAVMFLGSLFAAADAAITAIPEAHLRALANEAQTNAIFSRYAADPARVLSRWLVARVVCISFASAIIHGMAERAGIPGFGPLLAVGVAVVAYGTCTEILGTLARRRPVRVASISLRLLRPLEYAVVPLAEPLAWLGRIIGRRLPEDEPADARMTETEVEFIVSEGERSGAIANAPAEMIRNVLDFKDLTAREVMVPRRRILGIEIGTSLERVLEIVTAEGHSRYPVFKESLDHVQGLLYVKDLFRVVRDKKIAETKLVDLVRTPVMFVAETQSAAKILPDMQSKRVHLAVVSDEFGGTAGLITLEDVIEEIVGDIRDEYDTEAQIRDMGDGRIVADAAVSLDELSQHLGRPLPSDGEFESLGGLIVHKAGRVPVAGSTFQLDGLKLIVKEADQTRVVKVEIVRDHPVAPTR